jgi:hypothetical protein
MLPRSALAGVVGKFGLPVAGTAEALEVRQPVVPRVSVDMVYLKWASMLAFFPLAHTAMSTAVGVTVEYAPAEPLVAADGVGPGRAGSRPVAAELGLMLLAARRLRVVRAAVDDTGPPRHQNRKAMTARRQTTRMKMTSARSMLMDGSLPVSADPRTTEAPASTRGGGFRNDRTYPARGPKPRNGHCIRPGGWLLAQPHDSPSSRLRLHSAAKSSRPPK